MAAETLTSARASATFPVAGNGPAGDLKAGWGTYAIAAAVEDGDIFEMHWVPDGATVIGGYTMSDDIDTGTEALDMDTGWAANSSDAADPDGLGNHGVWTGDVSVHVGTAGVFLPHAGVLASAGPKTFTKGGGSTMIQVEANVASNAGHTGQLTVVTHYLMP